MRPTRLAAGVTEEEKATVREGKIFNESGLSVIEAYARGRDVWIKLGAD